LDLPTLESHFGRYGVRLYELERGVDESKVGPDRPTQSIWAEDTVERDVPLTETEPMIRKLLVAFSLLISSPITTCAIQPTGN